MALKTFIDNTQSTDTQSFYDRLVRMLGLSKEQPKAVRVKQIGDILKLDQLTEEQRNILKWQYAQLVQSMKDQNTSLDEYYKYEPGPEITGTGIIADTFRDFEEWNRDHQMPITQFSNPVLDPSDGDLSVTINGRDHLWIDDNAVIAIAHYIENQAK